MGIREDTHLVGQQYSYLGMFFWVGYLALELPTQLMAQHISRLGLYLGVNIILWGIAVASHAACYTFAGLAVCRTLLGVFESCVAPILVFIVSMVRGPFLLLCLPWKSHSRGASGIKRQNRAGGCHGTTSWPISA